MVPYRRLARLPFLCGSTHRYSSPNMWCVPYETRHTRIHEHHNKVLSVTLRQTSYRHHRTVNLVRLGISPDWGGSISTTGSTALLVCRYSPPNMWFVSCETRHTRIHEHHNKVLSVSLRQTSYRHHPTVTLFRLGISPDWGGSISTTGSTALLVWFYSQI